jgi:hypothetical protein
MGEPYVQCIKWCYWQSHGGWHWLQTWSTHKLFELYGIRNGMFAVYTISFVIINPISVQLFIFNLFYILNIFTDVKENNFDFNSQRIEIVLKSWSWYILLVGISPGDCLFGRKSIQEPTLVQVFNLVYGTRRLIPRMNIKNQIIFWIVFWLWYPK